MAGTVVVQTEPTIEVGDNFCAYMEGFDASTYLADINMPPTRNTVEADTSRNRGVRTLTTKQGLAFSATGFRDYTDPTGFTPYLDSLLGSGQLSQIMYFPATDEPAGIYGWAGRFFLTEADGPAAVGAGNSVSIAGVSPNERNLVRSLQPFRQFLDSDFPIAGDIVNEPSGATAFGGAGFLQIMALGVTGVADIAVEIAHSNDAFAADDNQLIDLGTYGDTAPNEGGLQSNYVLLGDDVTVEKDTRVKVTKTGVGTIDLLQFAVGFHRSLSLVKP